jgi:hypothetical protein
VNRPDLENKFRSGLFLNLKKMIHPASGSMSPRCSGWHVRDWRMTVSRQVHPGFIYRQKWVHIHAFQKKISLARFYWMIGFS